MKEEIFPVTIWKGKVKNFEAVQEDVSRCVNEAKWDYYQEENWMKTSKFHRADPFEQNVLVEYDMQNLMDEIEYAVKETYPNYTFNEYTRPISWMVHYDDDDYTHVHSHGNATIAGAYYYDVPENDNSFFFTSSIEQIAIRPIVNTGTLLLFPGWQNHGVSSTRKQGIKRTVLSFNLHF